MPKQQHNSPQQGDENIRDEAPPRVRISHRNGINYIVSSYEEYLRLVSARRLVAASIRRERKPDSDTED
jgi:hypothetical protein